MSTGGALWFPDLAAPDATMLLPLLAASTFFAMIEVGVDGQQLDANPQMKQMKNVMRALALVLSKGHVSASQNKGKAPKQ